MISQFVFGCVFEAVSGGLLAWTWLRMRKAERERAKALEDCLALGSEVETIVAEGESLRTELGAKDQELERQRAELAALLANAPAQGEGTRALEQRCRELEEALSREAELENSRTGRVEELANASHARAMALESELAQANERLSQQTREIEALSANLAERDAALAGAEDRHARLQEDIGRLKAAHEDLAAEARSAERGTELVEERRLAMEREVRIETLTRRCEELDQAAADADARGRTMLAEAQAHLSEREARLAAREAELAEQRRLATERDVRIETLARRCEELDHAATDERALARAMLAEANQRLSECESRLEGREAELAARGVELSCLVAERDGLRARHEELAARCGSLESEARRLAAELEGRDQACASLARTAEAHEAEARRLAAEVARLEQDGRARREQAEALAGNVRDLEAQLAEQRHEHAGAREEVRRSRHEHEQRAARYEAELSEQVRQLEEQRGTVARLTGELDSREELRAIAAARLAELEAGIAREREEVARREHALAEAHEARVAELELRLCGAIESAEGLRRDAAQLTERCRSLWSLVENRAQDLGERERALNETRAAAEALAYAVDTCREEIEKRDRLVDAWSDAQLEALLRRRLGPRPGPLPGACEDALAAGDLGRYLAGLLGDGGALSPEAVSFLCERWQREWSDTQRAPIDREVSYLWAAGLGAAAATDATVTDGSTQSFLFALGAFSDGSRAVLAIRAGDPSGAADWLGLLSNLAQRGMNVPQLVVGASSSGVWRAIGQLGWNVGRQHCWTHARESVLAALPRELRARVAPVLRDLAACESRREEQAGRERLVKRCGKRHAAAAAIVSGDWKRLTAFRSYPKEHWSGLRSTDCLTRPLAVLRLAADALSAGGARPYAEGILWRLLAAGTRIANGEEARVVEAVDRVPSLIRQAGSPSSDSGTTGADVEAAAEAGAEAGG